MDNGSQKKRLYIAISFIFIILLLSFAIIFFGVFQVYYAPASLFRGEFNQTDSVEEHFEARVVNIALIGLHNREDDNTFGEIYYADTIMVASINFDRNTLKLLAVPRDSYVQIARSSNKDRIRQAYSYGYNRVDANRHEEGMQTVIETIDNLLSEIELHHYIAIDIQGLKQLVDSLGGVYYTVENDMIGYTEKESLNAGPQLLSGQGYITYLTFREEDSRDDLNRIKRQKTLVLSTFDYYKEMGMLQYIIPTYAAYREHLFTTLSFNQVAALTLFISERLDKEAIYDYSLTGDYFRYEGDSHYYLLLNEMKMDEVLNDFLSLNKP